VHGGRRRRNRLEANGRGRDLHDGRRNFDNLGGGRSLARESEPDDRTRDHDDGEKTGGGID
jgi:hypothetical protein